MPKRTKAIFFGGQQINSARGPGIFFGGRGKAGEANLAGAQSRGDILDAHFAEGAVDQRADDKANHLAEKAVAVEVDCHATTFLPGAHGVNRAKN